ncbi:hypothetical protein L195_g028441, partial [Trifolium pratense]
MNKAAKDTNKPKKPPNAFFVFKLMICRIDGMSLDVPKLSLCPQCPYIEFILVICRIDGLMQAKPATASGLIRAGPLQNATSAKPGAGQTYSVA